MTLIPQAFAYPAQISNLENVATNIPLSTKIADLFTLSAFNLVNFIFVIIGLAFFANLIIVGWEYMLSSGDPKKVASASTRLINGFTGLIMAVLAFIVVRLVIAVFGLGTSI
jgi:hypothetical protein